MTCIIGLIEKGKAYIAGDRAGSNGFTKMKCKDEKIFKKGGVIFGFSGSFRMGQILRHELEIPERGVDERIDSFVYKKMVKAIKKCFKDNGFGIEKDGDSKCDVGGNFLFIIESRIFEMQGDFSVLESKENYCAVGSGEYHAMAAMEILVRHTKLKPEEKLKEAMRATAKYVMSVSEECDIIF